MNYDIPDGMKISVEVVMTYPSGEKVKFSAPFLSSKSSHINVDTEGGYEILSADSSYRLHHNIGEVKLDMVLQGQLFQVTPDGFHFIAEEVE